MTIRNSTEQDFNRIMEIYAFAHEYMKTHENPNQQGSTNWLLEELILNDIRECNSYVCLNEAENVVGVFYFIQGYCTQGLKLLIEEARKIVPENELYLHCNIDNPASLKVMLKNGGVIHHKGQSGYYVRIKLR